MLPYLSMQEKKYEGNVIRMIENVIVQMQKVMDDSGGFLFIMHPPSVVMYRDNIKPGLYPNGGFKLSDFQPAN